MSAVLYYRFSWLTLTIAYITLDTIDVCIWRMLDLCYGDGLGICGDIGCVPGVVGNCGFLEM